MRRKQPLKSATLVHDTIAIGGGGEATCGSIAAFLRDSGYQVTLLAETRDLTDDLKVQLKGVDVKLIPWRRLPYWISHIFTLYYALFIRLTRRQSIMVDSLGLLVGPALADVTYVHYPGLPDQRTHRSLRRILSLAIFATSAVSVPFTSRRRLVLFNSKWSRDASFAALPFYHGLAPKEAQFAVLYPPVETGQILSLPTGPRPDDTLLTVSRFARVKGLERIVPLAKMTPALKYVVAGRVNDPGYVEELKTLISAQGLESRITLVENFDSGEKANLYGMSSVLVHFASREHFGIVLVEALAAGMTVVAQRFGGATEFLPPDFLYDDESQIPGLVVEALRNWNPEVASKNRDKALEFSEERFRAGLQEALALHQRTGAP